MKVLRGVPESWHAPERGSAVTIGVFDGVHLGHRRTIARLRAEATEHHLVPVVMTFDRHPLSVVAPDRAPRLLTTVDHRIELFAQLGIEVVAVLPFTPAIRDLSPEEFSDLALRRGLNARLVVVGEDFRFGRDRAGDVEALRTLGAEHEFEVQVVGLMTDREGPLSSTNIRRAVSAGDMEEAARQMGRWFELTGRSERINGESAALRVGLPDEVEIPAPGLYVGWVRRPGGGTLIPASITVTGDRLAEAQIQGSDLEWEGLEVGLLFRHKEGTTASVASDP